MSACFTPVVAPSNGAAARDPPCLWEGPVKKDRPESARNRTRTKTLKRGTLSSGTRSGRTWARGVLSVMAREAELICGV